MNRIQCLTMLTGITLAKFYLACWSLNVRHVFVTLHYRMRHYIATLYFEICDTNHYFKKPLLGSGADVVSQLHVASVADVNSVF